MSQPPAYSRTFSFSNFQAANPTQALPGTSVDLELNNAKATLDAVLANLTLIQRDDGAVKNASIGLDQLKAEVPVGFNAPQVWATGIAYIANSSTVFNGSGFYRCLITHTSTVFATDLATLKWQLIVNLAAVPLVNASQIAVTPSGMLTTDAQTSLQALDAGKAATSHTHPASAISDSTTPGRALLTAVDVAAQQTALGISLIGFVPGNIKETAGLTLESGWYYCDGSAKNRSTDAALFAAISLTQTGVLTSGSSVITGLSDTSKMSPWMPLSGSGIPAATLIQSVDSSSQITMSANATGTATTPVTVAPYGVGDGSTTFNLPNRAYAAVGRDNASGSASNINQKSTSLALTNGSVTATVGDANALAIFHAISHPKVPIGTFISAIVGTTITMSAAATGTVTSTARFSAIGDAQTLGAVAALGVGVLATAMLPPYTPAGTNAATFTASGGDAAFAVFDTGGILSSNAAGGSNKQLSNAATQHAVTGTVASTFTGTAQGGTTTPFKTYQPTIVMNFIIKR